MNVAAGQVMSDPVIAAAVRRINRNGLIHWATANIENPGAPVSRYLSPDMQNSARELVRRDLTDLVFASARSSQSILWQYWMELAFTLTQDSGELHELLAVSSRSIAAAIDANMEVMAEFLRIKREAYVPARTPTAANWSRSSWRGRRSMLRRRAGAWAIHWINLTMPRSSRSRRRRPRVFWSGPPRRWRDARIRAACSSSSPTRPRSGCGRMAASRSTWNPCGA